MTIGPSPKVVLPATALVALAGVLYVIAGITGESALTTVAGTLLAAAGVQIPVGYLADPGIVRPRTLDEPGNDELLDGMHIQPPTAG